ncbi:hypothetical protein [Chelativorans salis]|nr:hypothetical protein [Chelativorans sp. EGI FJ00035]
MPAAKSSLINAIDTLAEAEGLFETAFMATEALDSTSRNAMSHVLHVALQRLADAKGQLYAIHDPGGKRLQEAMERVRAAEEDAS